MEGDSRQKKKAAVVDGMNTPKRKNRRLERAVIGSSSTWKEEQLELFRATLSDPTSAKEMIPEKWFEFSGLKDYQAGITSCVLTDCSSGRTSIDPTL